MENNINIKKFKKNMFLDYGYSSTSEEKMKLIKANGFDGIFLFADDLFEENVKLASKYGLNIETIHLPFQGVCNSVWEEGLDGDNYASLIMNWIDKASNNNIDKVIFHLSQSNTPPQMTELGFVRIKKILEHAKDKKVFVAFENLRNLEYLEATMDRFGLEDNAICCFDVGHASCFSKNIKTYDFPRYKGLIKCLHIHDNHGERDEHLLPFEGSIDYEEVFTKLKKIGYDGELTLEVIGKHSTYTEEEYVKKAKEALDKIETYL